MLNFISNNIYVSGGIKS